MKSPEFDPYIEDAEPLTAQEIDSRIKELDIAYYGVTPEGAVTQARHNYNPINVEDDSGTTPYSVLISGDLPSAKRILVKGMSWSDHPGRGFEALREALIADPSENLAVVGVSFPGAGMEGPPMTAKQKEALKSEGGDFSFIGAQQWKAIESALSSELHRLEPSASNELVDGQISNYEFILSGSSQGSPNAVGLLQSKPENIKVAGLGLALEIALAARGYIEFLKAFVEHGSKNFKLYVGENPYNEYPDLGPGMNLAKNVLARPASHLFSVVHAMRKSHDVDKILSAVKEREIEDLSVTLAAASEDGLGIAELHRKAAATLNASNLVVARSVIWQGHYHPVMENLANAQTAFRDFNRL